jgi:hypothetical protein
MARFDWIWSYDVANALADEWESESAGRGPRADVA